MPLQEKSIPIPLRVGSIFKLCPRKKITRHDHVAHSTIFNSAAPSFQEKNPHSFGPLGWGSISNFNFLQEKKKKIPSRPRAWLIQTHSESILLHPNHPRHNLTPLTLLGTLQLQKAPTNTPSLSASCNTILDFFDGVKRFHTGDHLSLNLFGSPARTNDTQYAMSSSAKSVALGDISVKVPVPFALKRGGGKKVNFKQVGMNDEGKSKKIKPQTQWSSL